MLGYNDKFILIGNNIINRKREMTNHTISFPITEDNLYIPEDILQMSIFEYHEVNEYKSYGYEVFKIYVGKITSINQICSSSTKNVKFKNNVLKSIKTEEDKMCYFDDDLGRHIVFAKLNKNDIVVDNIEELKNALIFISKKIQNIKDITLDIKRYNEETQEINKQRKNKNPKFL